MASTDHTFTLSYRGDYKSKYLVYEEPGHKLEIYLERTVSKIYDYSGSPSSFRVWTEPRGEVIPSDKQSEILTDMMAWAADKKLSIDICEPNSIEDFEHDYIDRGWTVTRMPNGELCAYPPVKRSLMTRIRALAGYLRSRRTK